MARSLSDHDIATVLGLSPPEKVAPGNRAEAAMEDVGALDDRLAAHVEKNRQIRTDGSGQLETHEQAHSRILTESPGLYTAHKAERARLLKKHGVGAAAASGGQF